MDEAFAAILALVQKYERLAKETPLQLSIIPTVSRASELFEFLEDVETIAQVFDITTTVPFKLSLGEAVFRMRVTLPQKLWSIDEIDNRSRYGADLKEEERAVVHLLEERLDEAGQYSLEELGNPLQVLLRPERGARL